MSITSKPLLQYSLEYVHQEKEYIDFLYNNIINKWLGNDIATYG